MKKRKSFILIALFSVFIACSNDSQQNTETNSADENVAVGTSSDQSTAIDEGSQKNIVQVASGSADHSTLVAAVKAGDLVNALSNAGPFTVFAPTNAAFDKLPSGTVENLLKPENIEALQNILQYHVSLAVFQPESFTEGQVIGQVNGDNITMHVNNGKISVNDANIIATVPASNGIIHVIDGVLLPSKE